jgi:hypothetical protein
MRIPASFPPQIRSMVRERLFGTSDAHEQVVLTPIRRIFDSCGPTLACGSGWWPVKSRPGLLIVHTPQASPMLDAICALESDTLVTFVGFSGGGQNSPVGSVWEVAEAATFGSEDWEPRTFRGPYLFEPARAITVSCFADSIAHRQHLSAAADCVDMETALVYATCRDQCKPARSIQIVSDGLQMDQFQLVSQNDSRIDKAIQIVGTALATTIIGQFRG